jgi:hypothetical protein
VNGVVVGTVRPSLPPFGKFGFQRGYGPNCSKRGNQPGLTRTCNQ